MAGMDAEADTSEDFLGLTDFERSRPEISSCEQ